MSGDTTEASFSVITQTCRGKWGPTRTCAHAHARNLPSPEALSPETEEGAVNRRSSGVARPWLWHPAAPAPSAILDPTPFTGGEVVT